MRSDIIGKYIGLFLGFVLMVVAPFVEYTAQKQSLEYRAITARVNDFIDEVVDSRRITDSMLKQLNSDLAAYSIPVDYKITREQRVVNPDPLNQGEYYSSLIMSDDNRNYDQGDHISIRVYEVGSSASASLAHRIAGAIFPKYDYTFPARVR